MAAEHRARTQRVPPLNGAAPVFVVDDVADCAATRARLSVVGLGYPAAVPVSDATEVRRTGHGRRVVPSAELRTRAPRVRRSADGTSIRVGWHPRPAQSVAIAFALAILTGTGFLMLPAAAAGRPASFVEALLTATSTVCVTGLAAVDTATFWSPLGHAIMLGLIQLGGFGIMTFASIIGIGFARKMSLAARLNSSAEARTVDFDDARQVVLGVLRITAIVEGTIAAILTLRFALQYGKAPGEALWYGVFHSISAFNNAGFALFSDSMIGFVGDPWICLPICAGIILGGIGFPTILQIRRYGFARRKWTITTRIALLMTPILILAGWLGIAVNEWSNPRTLGALDAPTRILASFFMSVQTRTAGFNSIDMGALDPATMLGIDVLMFIGAAPAGTAGGIKVTTFLVMLAFIWAELRGSSTVRLLGKTMPRGVLQRAITVGLLGAGCVGTGVLILLATTSASLDAILLEVISAYGTVGLSANLTPTLPPHAHLVLVALMYVGRLGPLTLGIALARARHPLPYDLPEERPIIG